MKKTTTILLLVLQFFLLIIFQNIYSVFKEFGEVDLTKIRDPMQLMNNIKSIKRMFSVLFIVTSLFFISTAIYLGFQFRKPKQKTAIKGIPPLHDYLLELKDSETELKTIIEKQQAHVIEKEELSKSIINNINSAVIFLNQSGRIDIFNAVAQQLFSQSYANAKNNLPGDVLAKFPEIVQFLQDNEDRKVSKEITSKERVFFVDLNPIETIGQLLIVKDITEEKKREEIDRRNSNFIMLGEMTAFLAHEIRNSLGVIYGYTRTINAGKDKIDKVNKEINFLSTMMESFLKFSKPVEVDKKEEVDLVELLEKISRENEIALEMNRETTTVESDPALLRSVFSNLLINSREAGADRVEVVVKRRKNKELEIRLTDNGKGIDADVKEKIWYPFFTTKKKGTGMGLAMIRKIINTLKGEISLADTGPRGTTFKITFYR
ncbi:MAG: ATP-binding protein [Candidatus Aminicenantes bacterium]|nr:MAG: ATP-binding protein [Candidatus Aminicenantes bacterium]